MICMTLSLRLQKDKGHSWKKKLGPYVTQRDNKNISHFIMKVPYDWLSLFFVLVSCFAPCSLSLLLYSPYDFCDASCTLFVLERSVQNA